MSCGGRVYKGDTIVISVPFDVEDYENLTITYTTTGDAKVIKTEDEVTIEDGFITYVSDGGELDLLPDGVIYYTISYEVDGVDHVISTNTPLYLKTPAGYSGKTADDIYQDGYEAGLNDCSGTSCMLYAGEYVLDGQFDGNSGMIYPDAGYNGFNSFIVTDGGYGDAKYQEGYADGLDDCSGSSCNLQSKSVVITADTQTVTPDQGYDGMSNVSIDANTYGQDMYNSGWTDGYNSGASCNLTEGELILANGWGGDTTLYPDSADGFSSVRIVDNSYGQEKYDSGHTEGVREGFASGYHSGWTDGYNSGVTTEYGEAIQNAYDSGYTAGQNDCSGATLVSYAYPLTIGWNGNTIIHPSDIPYGYHIDGINEMYIFDDGYGDWKYESGHTAGVESGWSAGWNAGFVSGASTTDCSEAIEESYGLGYESGYTDGYQSGYTDGYQSFPYRQGYYKAGEDSVIKSFLTGNDLGTYADGAYGYDNYGLVVAYYYTPSGQPCVITGYDKECDERWYDSFDSMSVDGGPWQSPQLYYYLTEGWHQIRFKVKDPDLHYAFNHNFPTSPVEINGNMVTPYMDALKAVSIPEASQYQSGVTGLIGTFKMNNGIRILSTSLKLFGVYVPSPPIANGNALSGATNLNIIISHYKGDENVSITSDVQNGILFYPEGKLSTHSSALSGWTKMELF